MSERVSDAIEDLRVYGNGVTVPGTQEGWARIVSRLFGRIDQQAEGIAEERANTESAGRLVAALNEELLAAEKTIDEQAREIERLEGELYQAHQRAGECSEDPVTGDVLLLDACPTCRKVHERRRG